MNGVLLPSFLITSRFKISLVIEKKICRNKYSIYLFNVILIVFLPITLVFKSNINTIYFIYLMRLILIL